MSADGPETTGNELVSQIIAAYLQACQGAQPPSPEALLAKYPQVATELQAFFRDRHFLDAGTTYSDTSADAPTMPGPAWRSVAAQPERETYEIGSVFAARYRIVGKTKGGMGRVYFADDLDVGEFGRALRVAIKTVPDFAEWKEIFRGGRADAGVYADQVARFRREALAWVRLGMHPNIIWAIWTLDVGAKPYLVMEYADGGSLLSRLEAGRLSVPLAVNFGLQFCAGMKHAVRVSAMVHRDIKPANVLIKEDRIIKIADFGLAKAFESEIAEPRATAALEPDSGLSDGVQGTPVYMAPEQFRGLRLADTRSDIFSFGAMLHEMLTGQRLFTAVQSAYEFAILAARLPTVRDFDRDVPAMLSDIVSRCLEHNPADRYQSFDDLSVALSQLDASLERRLPMPVDESHAKRVALLTPSLALLAETYTLITIGRFAEAASTAAKAITLDPTNAQHWINKAKAHGELGDWRLAQTCSVEATRLNPRDPHGWANLGWANLALGDAVAGLEAARRAIGVDSGFADAWMCRGACERRLGKYAEAIMSSERAVRLEPYNWKAQSNLASQLKDTDRFDAAFDALTRSTEINPHDAGGWRELAWLHARVQSWEDASLAVDSAIREEPNNAKSWALRAWIIWALGARPLEIDRTLDRAIAIDPSSAEVRSVREAVRKAPPVRAALKKFPPIVGPTIEASGWAAISGTRAKLQSVAQGLREISSRFGSIRFVVDGNAAGGPVDVEAYVECHNCGSWLTWRQQLRGAGVPAEQVSCICGSAVLIEVFATSEPTGYFVIASPHASETRETLGRTNILVSKVTRGLE